MLFPLVVAGCGASSGPQQPLVSALARAAADEASTLLGDGGTAVFIQIPDTPFLSKDDAAIDAALRAELADRGIEVIAVEDLPYDPRMENTGEPFTAGVLMEILQRHPDAGLLLSRVGLPRLSAGDLKQLPTRRPRLMIVTNYQIPYLHQLPPGFPDVAIFPRALPEEGAGEPSDSDDPFQQYYDIIRSGQSRTVRPRPWTRRKRSRT